MAYAVVYGADRRISRADTATQCLGLVKRLQSRAESNIQVFDDAGAELRLGELETRHKKEVEATYRSEDPSDKHALPVGSRMRRLEQHDVASASRSGWVTSVLLLTVTVPIGAAIVVRWLREKLVQRERP
ncbi:hypothetical protein [Methylocystis echinoides]|uniref:hypothetical protein n=1 Tax=Methylocystis echinoides TaxID=29468 RepID=UPI00343BBB31